MSGGAELMPAPESSSRNKGLQSKVGFDLGRLDTYYTRPMSPPWSSPLEVDRLADGASRSRLRHAAAPSCRACAPARPDVGGEVRGRAHFRRLRGLAVAELTCRARRQLQCQRCMQPLQLAWTRRRGSRWSPRGMRRRGCRRILSRCSPPAAASASRTSSRRSCSLSLPIVPLSRGGGRVRGRPRRSRRRARRRRHQMPFAQLARVVET